MRRQLCCRAQSRQIETIPDLSGKRAYLVLPRKEYPDEFKRLVGARRRNDLKDYLVNGCTDSYTIEELFEEFLSILRKRIDVDQALLVTSQERYLLQG